MGSSEWSGLLEPFSWRRQLSELRLQESWDELAVSRLREEAVSCRFRRILWPECWTSMSSEPEEWEMESRDSFRCSSAPGLVRGSSSEYQHLANSGLPPLPSGKAREMFS